jgi:hypothetical protein
MPSDRTDFLREYYQVLTDDIRRSEAIVPKVCATEGAAVVLLVLARWGNKSIYVPVLLVLLTSCWAMHLLINANLWARRGHLMAANVEREFFTSDDMNVLLPDSYYADARRYRYRRVFRISLLLSAAFFAIGLAALPFAVNLGTLSIFFIAALLILSAYLQHRNCLHEYAHLVEHAPGRTRDTTR